MITCRICHKTKKDIDFVINHGKATNLCKECRRERDRILYKKHNFDRLMSAHNEPDITPNKKMIEEYAETIAKRGFLHIREINTLQKICKKLTLIQKCGIHYLFQDKNGCRYSYTAVQLWALKGINEKEGRYKNVKFCDDGTK